MTGRGYFWTALLGVCALGSRTAPVAAQDAEENREAIIKAACLYNFAMHTQWPKDAAVGAKDKFHIGVVGKGDLNPFLKKIADTRTVHDKSIAVHHFPSLKDYEPCHVLFVSREPAVDSKESAADRLAAAVKKAKGTPTMIVSESEGLAEKGATINFYVEENVVKFEINLDTAKAAGLEISSKVLRLAKVIQGSKK
jgi:hypothetical protein